MPLSATVEDLMALVDSELQGIVNSRQIPLYRMMAYHMGWSDERGEMASNAPRERVRGALCLLACRAAGGDVEKALPAAAAIELVHNFTLIHDDVQGGNPQRDNRDAVWWVWGPAQAINAGDGMHALARLALFRLRDRGVPSEKAFRAVKILDEATLKACEGRFADLEAQERIDLSVDAYLKMASDKMGALMGCAMRLGALAASDDETTQDALGECGERLGVALQIRSDLHELWGDGGDAPPPSAEVMNKKKLLPVVYALEKANINEKRRLGEVYFQRVLQPDDVARVREVIEQLGARDACESLADQHMGEALAALDAAGVSDEGRGEIEGFVAGL